MSLESVILAALLFANPFGRFLVLGGRTSGIYLLQSQGWSAEIIFIFFAVFSSLGTLIGHGALYAFRSILAKRFTNFFKQVERQAYRFKWSAGQYGMFIGLAATSAFTSPLYASALATALNASFFESFVALVFSNLAYFVVLYSLMHGLVFDLKLTLLGIFAFLALGWLIQKAMKLKKL